MNKSELVEKLSVNADITKSAATRVIDSLISTVSTELSAGKDVVLVGFGTFKVKDRAARKGRNPQTGAEVDIPAAKVPSFKAGKTLKDACN